MLKIAYIEAREERSRSLDRVIGEFYPHKRQAFCASTGLFFLAWMAEGLEVYVIIWYQGGSAWLSLASLSPPSPFFHHKLRLLIPGCLGAQDGENVFSSRPSAIPASPSRCSGGSRARLGSEWDGDACDCREERD